ncbi:MAG TPA: efflux RND transporter periplasmic adaptor subunit [Candidatus Acidoferrales bacterium]
MKRKVLLIAIILIAGVAATAYYLGAFARPEVLDASGTIEARNIRVGSKIGGRIAEVLVREGDRVEPGQVLVTFESDELEAALQQARANLDKLERGSRPEEIAEARAAAARATAELDELRRGYRTEQVAAAQAEVERVRAELDRARITYERAKRLADEGVFSKQQHDDALAAYRAAEAAVRNAQERYEELNRGYRPEQVAAAEARLRQAEATRQLVERGFRAEDIAAGRAAMLDARTRYAERQVLAPAAAVVEVLDVRPGDLIAPNAPIATLLERDQLYIRVYVPETQLGLVRVGQRAELRVNSFPGVVFTGEVEQINQRAEFLPRNVQTREERVHQVFGVKVRVRDPDGKLRAGMAADVRLPLAEK